MTIAEAKQLRIVDYLASLGYHPQSVTSKQYWYLSPLRDERTPSFKVNDRLNEWYDFGAATGGDLVELGKHLYRTDSVSEVLACIGKHENAAPIQRVRIPGTTPRPVEADMKDVLVVPLQHHALLSYLHSRGIDGDIGRMFCREVHYELRQRRYFALAFGNMAGGLVITTLIMGALKVLSNAVLGFLPVPLLQIGLPGVLSLYFDCFTACMQAFIFSMLTMAYVGDARGS